MTAIISKQQFFELAVDVVISPLTNYFVEKAYPTPHRSNLLVLSIVDAIVRHSMLIFGPKIAEYFTVKAGYKDSKGKITNLKFVHLNFAYTAYAFLPSSQKG